MNNEQLVKLLQEHPFAADLSAGVMEKLAEASIVIDYPAGAVLFREGSANQNFYLLCEGSVALSRCACPREAVSGY